MGRWLEKENIALAEMKKAIKSRLDSYPQYPEVVGDRRLIRFLRGFNLDVEKASKMYLNFLKWRDENKVNEIRNNILYGGINHPELFPKGKLILELMPQIVITTHVFDKSNNPITFEQFGFDPTKVLEKITVQDYLLFLTYCLEYRVLFMEQLSEEREKELLAQNPNPPDGYGILVKMCCLRDLHGVGFKTFGSKFMSIIKTALEIAVPNYPEYLGKSVMVNVPWIFDTIWAFVKNLLDENTIQKISLIGTNYKTELLKDVPYESTPKSLGGGLSNDNYGFDFDIGPGGLYDPKAMNVETFVQEKEKRQSLRQSITHQTPPPTIIVTTPTKEKDSISENSMNTGDMSTMSNNVESTSSKTPPPNSTKVKKTPLKRFSLFLSLDTTNRTSPNKDKNSPTRSISQRPISNRNSKRYDIMSSPTMMSEEDRKQLQLTEAQVGSLHSYHTSPQYIKSVTKRDIQNNNNHNNHNNNTHNTHSITSTRKTDTDTVTRRFSHSDRTEDEIHETSSTTSSSTITKRNHALTAFMNIFSSRNNTSQHHSTTASETDVASRKLDLEHDSISHINKMTRIDSKNSIQHSGIASLSGGGPSGGHVGGQSETSKNTSLVNHSRRHHYASNHIDTLMTPYAHPPGTVTTSSNLFSPAANNRSIDLSSRKGYMKSHDVNLKDKHEQIVHELLNSPIQDHTRKIDRAIQTEITIDPKQVNGSITLSVNIDGNKNTVENKGGCKNQYRENLVILFDSIGTAFTIVLTSSPLITCCGFTIAALVYNEHNLFAILILIPTLIYAIYLIVS